MLSQTVMKNNFDIDSLVFSDEIKNYKFSNKITHFVRDLIVTSEADLNFFDLVSDNKKVIISSGIGPFHLLFETIFPIMEIASLDNTIEFIVDIGNIKYVNSTFINFIKESIGNRANITLIDSSNFDGIRTNRYIIIRELSNIPKDYVLNYAKELITVQSVASKKVYVSMKKSSIANKRIKNEESLEIFFLENGFEIVYPEDFNTVQDEINYFAQVSTLVSASSSALCWLIFMQFNGNILELQTEFPASEISTALHHQYSALSHISGHKYHSISNSGSTSAGLIDRIKSSNILKIL